MIYPMSQQDDFDMSRQTFWHSLLIKLSMGFNAQCNKLLNQHNSIPQTVFTNNDREQFDCWKKSIPFGVAVLYIMVQNLSSDS